MDRIARHLIRLYPAVWRERYGDELDALITDSGADARVIADLFLGGMRMQFSTWSFLRLAAVLSVAGILAGFGISMLKPVRYVARAEVRITGADSGVLTMQAARLQVTGRASLYKVITNPRIRLYPDLLRTAPLDDAVEQMRRDITIDTINPGVTGGEAFIVIQFIYPDAQKARLATQELAGNFAQVLRWMAPVQYGGQDSRYLDMIEMPAIPSRPMPLNPIVTGAIGLAGGLLLALLWRIVCALRGARGKSRRFGTTTFRLALAGTLAGIALVWAVANVIPPGQLPPGEVPLIHYQSTAKLYAHVDEATMARLLTKLTSRTALASLITDPRLQLYSGKVKDGSLEEAAEIMRGNLAVTSRKGAAGIQWIDISFMYPDRFKTQQTVVALMNRLDEDFHTLLRTTAASPSRSISWGVVEGANPAPVTVESVSPSTSLVLKGFLAGLALALVIALFRRRWTKDDQDIEAVQAVTSARVFSFSGTRFRRFAFWLTALGTAAGTIVALRTPVRYTSDALVAFENGDPYQAARLINDATSRGMSQIVSDRGLYGVLPSQPKESAEFKSALTRARRDLTWEWVESAGTKTDAFRIRFAADQPERARAALQDVLGNIDRSMMKLHGGDDTPFEAIRGVDGALLPVTDAVALKGPNPFGELSAAPLESTAVTNFGAKALEPQHSIAIPFDDDRAKPVPQPQYRAMGMNVIDTPGLPTRAEGIGWWVVAIGCAGGLGLAALLTVIAGFGGGLAARREEALLAPPSY